MNNSKGLFVTLEGVEGSGKSTQVKLLCQWLEKKGYPYIVTREPGGTPIGEKIREILIDNANNRMDPLTEVMLFAAARRQHVHELIKPKLADGFVVICDRFADATTAYQGYGRGINLDDIKCLTSMCLWGVSPDITICLDLEPEIGRERVSQRYSNNGGDFDRLEKLDSEFFARVRRGYLELAHEEPERFRVVDASRTKEDVLEDIKSILRKDLDRLFPTSEISLLKHLEKDLFDNQGE